MGHRSTPLSAGRLRMASLSDFMMNVARAIGKCQNHMPCSCANGMYLGHGTRGWNLWSAPTGRPGEASVRCGTRRLLPAGRLMTASAVWLHTSEARAVGTCQNQVPYSCAIGMYRWHELNNWNKWFCTSRRYAATSPENTAEGSDLQCRKCAVLHSVAAN